MRNHRIYVVSANLKVHIEALIEILTTMAQIQP